MSNKWTKEELEILYETQTLEQIGQKFGVSRERIRQVMDKFGIKRRASNPVKGSKQPKIEYPDPTTEEIAKVCEDIRNKKVTCSACGGKGYIEYEHGLIQSPCKECQK